MHCSPLVAQQNIATWFAYLAPQCTHLVEQTGTALFSGGALIPAPKGPTPNLNHRKKQKGKNQVKAAWGSRQNSASPGHFAGAGFQAQTPPTFLGSDREAEYVAEIQQLWTMLATHCHCVFAAAARVCGTKWLFGSTSSLSLLWSPWLEQ
jgi:hypothetical protein